MEKMYKAATKYTPEIVLDPNGYIHFKGKAYPEDTQTFYAPVLEWIKEYLNNPAPKTTIEIELLYFNSGTSKFLFNIFDMFDNNEKTKTYIQWVYYAGNDGMKEFGEDFEDEFDNIIFDYIQRERQ